MTAADVGAGSPDDGDGQVVDQKRQAQQADGLPGVDGEAGGQDAQARTRETDQADQAASPAPAGAPDEPIGEDAAQQRADRAAEKRQPGE